MPYCLRIVRPLPGRAVGDLVSNHDEMNKLGASQDAVRVWIEDADMPKPDVVSEPVAEPKPEPKGKPDAAAK